MASININGVPYEYNEELLTHENISPISEVSARKILDLSKELFEKRDMFFFLWWGTLLGAVRDHGIIPGDEDVDCGIMDEKKLIESIPFLYDNGLKIIRHIPGRLYSFRTDDNCYIDFYIISPLKFSLWSLWCCHAGSYVMEKKHFRKFKEMDFLGGKYMVPDDTEAMLERLYGKTWRIPQKGHLWHSEVPSYYFWKHKFVPFILEVVGYPYWRHLTKGNLTKEESLKEWRQYKANEKSRKK